MRPILIILLLSAVFITTKSYGQKWLPGHFTDTAGNAKSGLIRIDGPGKPPVKDQGFIEVKENNKAAPFEVSAGQLRSFVIGRDSFIVAHAPGNETWARNDLDFVRVVLDEDPKLYAAVGVMTGGGHGSGFSIEPGISTGIGTGIGGRSYVGTAVGAGVDIPIGGGGGDVYYVDAVYYYGDNTAHMKRLNDKNFIDIMTDVMGDYPEVVDKIRAKVYLLANIGQLLDYYEKVKAAASK
jgi:hypothetical protein